MTDSIRQKIYNTMTREHYDKSKIYRKVINQMANRGDGRCKMFLESQYGIRFLSGVPDNNYQPPNIMDILQPFRHPTDDNTKPQRPPQRNTVTIRYTMKQLEEMINDDKINRALMLVSRPEVK